jgi:menaquinol-cytochrome c reductase iron-sulfur subunit
VAQVLAALFGAVSLLVPLVAGIVAFLNPLRQRGRNQRWIRVAPLAVLPDNGTPRKFPLIAERHDGWMRFPPEPVGAVFLRRVSGELQVVAFQVKCPHAGCAIDYQSTPGGGKFFCPCHRANFDLEGRRADAVSPSPRDMDRLAVELREGVVWVRL